MEEPPEPVFQGLLLDSFLTGDLLGISTGLIGILVLLAGSAMISGSEVAFFSLTPENLQDLQERNTKRSERVLKLLAEPKRLLATVLIANNFINIAIIILSTYLTNNSIDFGQVSPMAAFLIQVVVVTFMILLVGEVIPKVYAAKYNFSVSLKMSGILNVLDTVFYKLGISRLLIRSTSMVEKRFVKKGEIASVEDLSDALDLIHKKEVNADEHKILEGIVKFGNTDVKQIMRSRVDVEALDKHSKYNEVLKLVSECGFSRIPVFEDSFDKIEGVLYVKDLLTHLDEDEDFNWAALIRSPFFVPENKKIDDLLKEFQEKKIHLAVVVDEYGGTSGIVTLEDIIEEIVGDITDEFDDEDLEYSKLNDWTYVFEGKIPLKDMYRVLEIEGEEFEQTKGDADTLAGFVLELAGKIPQKNERLKFNNYELTIEASDPRRVKRVKVKLPRKA